MQTSIDTGLDGTNVSSRTGAREDQMSAASHTITAAPDLRPLAAFIGGLILAGAIATGLSAQAAAPATTPVLNTAPNADHGWSSEAQPLPGTAGGSGFSRAGNVAR
jgi:hypothetical protein